jgi:hypothetical protein
MRGFAVFTGANQHVCDSFLLPATIDLCEHLEDGK